MNIPYKFARHALYSRVKTLVGYSIVAASVASCGGAVTDPDGENGDIGETPPPEAIATPSPGVVPTPTVSITPTPVSSPVAPSPTDTPFPVPTSTPVVDDQLKVVYAINVGSESSLFVGQYLTYSEDGYFTGGRMADTSDAISGTDREGIYQSERWGEFSYALPVDNGEYEITLQFAEFHWTSVGDRVFDVDIEGNRFISDLDIIAEVGANTAHDQHITNVNVNDGFLNLDFNASQDSAKLSGIVVMGLDTVVDLPTPPVATPTPGISPAPVVTPTPVFTPFPTPAIPTPNPVVTPSPTPPTPIPSPVFTPEPGGTPSPELDGAQLYTDFGCTACHGNDGQQVSQPIVFENYTFETFLAKIDATMPPPPFDPESCSGDCAEAVAEYAWSLRPQISCDSEEILPRRVRMLTKFEYINTLNDLFSRSDASVLASGIGSNTVVAGFDNNAEANKISSTQLDAYWNSAEAFATSSNLSPWLSTNNCSQQNDIGFCFVEKFGREAFRRDLTNDEISDYSELFDEGSDDTEGAQIVVQTMLVSSNFLYRTELGQNGELTQYEIANLLSYTFWGSMPDETLLDKAASNQLSSNDQLAEEVERLIANSKAEKQFVHFGRQWLDVESVANLDRDTNQFPEFTDSIASAMDDEVDLFLSEVLLQDGYQVSDILKTDFVFVNQELANFYGMNGVSGSAMQKVEANDQRGGILSLGAVLARNAKFDDTHPIERGLVVRRNLLCQEFGTPPAVIGEVEPFDPNKPTRERFAAHTANEACASCHQYIDDIGFAFENYDAVGQFRLTEGNNLSIDASGDISGLERMTDPDVHTFSDLDGLTTILSTDGLDPVSDCFVETFQRMTQGVEEPDSCTTDNIVSRWDSGSVKDLWIEIIASQSFTQRQ